MNNKNYCDPTKPLIELKQATKAFGSNVILDKVDLTIYQGDALVIIGPSGSGKSTILRIIAGLIPLDAGQVLVQGQPRIGLIDDAEDPIRISLVFQQSALFDSLTVDENVGFLLYQHSDLPRKKIRTLVEKTLEMVGLPGTADLYPAALSGGMRKRVSFARAIIANPDNPHDNPELILYDEPTAGLDPIASTVIEDLVLQLQHTSGVCGSYVMVSHQHSTICRTANRVVLLYSGKIQWQGNRKDLDTTNDLNVRQFLSGSIEGPIKVAN